MVALRAISVTVPGTVVSSALRYTSPSFALLDGVDVVFIHVHTHFQRVVVHDAGNLAAGLERVVRLHIEFSMVPL